MFGSIGDPVVSAKELTEKYMLNAVQRLKSQKAGNAIAQAGLTRLQGALNSFQNALKGLSGVGGIVKQKASLSNQALGEATASANPQSGRYAFFVKQLASAHQVAFKGLSSYAAKDAGTLGIALATGESFRVDLSAANADASGNVSPAELARAINQAVDNKGKVSASIVTIEGEQRLVLTSGGTGEASAISLDTSGIGDAALSAVLSGPPDELSMARDAIFKLGGESGVDIKQSSNTFTGIQGVSVTFKQSMVEGDAPLLLDIKLDQVGTTDAVQAFVDAYNKAMGVLAELTKVNPDDPSNAGPFVGDAGVRHLQQRMNALLRATVGERRMLDYGISADRAGKLSLDTGKLNAALAKNPNGLDALFADPEKGVVARMDAYLKTWTSSVDGQVKRRQESAELIEQSLKKKERSLEVQYRQVYGRYLTQFTRVAELQKRMEYTKQLLDDLLSGNKK
ncbi:flagellar hook-associated 2 domain protein [Burkholderia orbicola MC0-3]|uniref:Flagellar hook-associated protein 2 n=2 Tax=Burkholderia TaxID=32008 RepID=B1K3B5_BURO0|nr:flagellar filament capping protein FliD [Burkholderia cenocepacia]ACA93794.1 flagellar hook-associated 2 domain protein [Burkholderia orbicola MC0-3]MCA8085870.1 flagellar filament capping protein FliD [Burkholderia cenocepacia]